MWALRRAAIPTRIQSHGILIYSSCNTKSNVPSMESDIIQWNYDGDGYIAAKNIFLEPNSCVPSSSMASFLGSRKLSSQAEAKSSIDEYNVVDRFPDLGVPPVSRKVEVFGGKVAEGGLPGEDGVSEADLVENADNSLGLSDGEAGTDGVSAKTGIRIPLVEIVLETGCQSMIIALDKWVEKGNPLGRREISMIMLNLRKRKFYRKALQFAEWLAANKHLEFTERDYASLIDLVAKVRGFQKAEKYIEKIPEPFRGEMVYRTLLAYCASLGDTKQAEKIFYRIRDLGFPITTFSCDQLLLLYKRVDRTKIAGLLSMMEKENVKPSLLTYRLLIATKVQYNDISGIEKLLKIMKSEGSEPDLMTQAAIARCYILVGLNEKAESVLKEMEGDGIKENRNACKALLPLYAALGRTEDVMRIWKACEGHPRVDEWLAAIDAWGRLGHVENAEKIFEDFLKVSEKPSLRSFNALLKVYTNHKLVSKGMELIKRMSASGCSTCPLTWDALVKLHIEAGEVEKADIVLQEAAQQTHMRPRYSSLMAVLEEYAQRGDVRNAERIFHMLRQTGYTVRMTQYQALLCAYVNANTPTYRLRERMKADNLFPDKAMAVQLAKVNAFWKAEFLELLD